MEGTYQRPLAASEIIYPVEMPSKVEDIPADVVAPEVAPVTPEVAPEAPVDTPTDAPAPTAAEKLAGFFSNLITPTAA